ncbi:MAG TPA: alpha/beta fold hydrolase, partial [Verrucomicrobiae bacterium]|nr:alpha/beta fold hydrolase [Verrucomicrobiae bacterium]
MLGRILLGALVLLVLAAAIGWFALRRGDIPYETLEARYAVPTSHYVDLPSGIRAHYRDDGPADAPVVLLVHGFGDSFLSWADWIEVLSRDFRVITVDVPGHGLTRAPADYAPSGEAFVAFIDEFTTTINVPRFAIAGNSMGGGLAWRTTVEHAERVTALVLLNAAGFANENQEPPSLAFKLLSTPFGRFLLENIETRPLTGASLRGNFVDASVVTDEFVTRWVDVQRAPGHRHILMNILGGGAAPDT